MRIQYRNNSDNTAKSKIFTSSFLPITYPVVKVRLLRASGPRVPPAIRWLVASGYAEDTNQGIDRELQVHAGRTKVVETRRLELLTLSLQRRCSSS